MVGMVAALTRVSWWNSGAFFEVVPEGQAAALIDRLRRSGYYVWSMPVMRQPHAEEPAS